MRCSLSHWHFAKMLKCPLGVRPACMRQVLGLAPFGVWRMVAHACVKCWCVVRLCVGADLCVCVCAFMGVLNCWCLGVCACVWVRACLCACVPRAPSEALVCVGVWVCGCAGACRKSGRMICMHVQSALSSCVCGCACVWVSFGFLVLRVWRGGSSLLAFGLSGPAMRHAP